MQSQETTGGLVCPQGAAEMPLAASCTALADLDGMSCEPARSEQQPGGVQNPAASTV